jgi:hypothetical protein
MPLPNQRKFIMTNSVNDAVKPFSREYVLRTTVKHVLKDIDVSIQKTMDRIPEFTGDSAKSLEILNTLSDLHAFRASINPQPAA